MSPIQSPLPTEVSREELLSMKRIWDQYAKDEHRDYQNSNYLKSHIYRDLLAIKEVLNRNGYTVK